MKAQRFSVLILVTAGFLAAGTAIVADRSEAEVSAPAYTVKAEADAGEFKLVAPEDRHWTHDHLESLKAEETEEQSIYLSAVQMIKIERDQGDVYRAVPFLESLAQRATTQKLRNAVRRLLVDLYLEEGDYKSAETELNKIIDESLLQL